MIRKGRHMIILPVRSATAGPSRRSWTVDNAESYGRFCSSLEGSRRGVSGGRQQQQQQLQQLNTTNEHQQLTSATPATIRTKTPTTTTCSSTARATTTTTTCCSTARVFFFFFLFPADRAKRQGCRNGDRKGLREGVQGEAAAGRAAPLGGTGQDDGAVPLQLGCPRDVLPRLSRHPLPLGEQKRRGESFKPSCTHY